MLTSLPPAQYSFEYFIQHVKQFCDYSFCVVWRCHLINYCLITEKLLKSYLPTLINSTLKLVFLSVFYLVRESEMSFYLLRESVMRLSDWFLCLITHVQIILRYRLKAAIFFFFYFFFAYLIWKTPQKFIKT